MTFVEANNDYNKQWKVKLIDSSRKNSYIADQFREFVFMSQHLYKFRIHLPLKMLLKLKLFFPEAGRNWFEGVKRVNINFPP